jgi:hypothetical protein
MVVSGSAGVRAQLSRYRNREIPIDRHHAKLARRDRNIFFFAGSPVMLSPPLPGGFLHMDSTQLD